MKNKLITSLLVFLLLIPFRLPVSILFIHFFNWIIGITTTEIIPSNILATNVIVTKLVYNIALSVFFVYSIEMFSQEQKGRKARNKPYPSSDKYEDASMYWWTFCIGILMVAFIIVDLISVHNIFFYSK